MEKMVGQTGLEPVTSRLSVVRSSQLSYRPVWNGKFKMVNGKFATRYASIHNFTFTIYYSKNGGGYRIRTDDILLAKQTLYQLS